MIKKTFSACLVVSAFLAAACTHPSPKTDEARIPASTGNLATHLTPEEAADLVSMISAQDRDRLHGLLLGERIAQTLVSSFDVRLERDLKLADMDTLLHSNLYCNLMIVRGQHERVEDKLMTAAQAAYVSGAAATTWFYTELVGYARKGVTEEAAVGQVLRQMVSQEQDICGAPGCVKNDVKQLRLSVDPLDNQAFAKFITDNKAQIARYSDSRGTDLKPGTCFEESRKPDQVSTYDWKNRNWVGSALPAGSFVFTYDDGPHASFTRVIRDTWASAGMAKPAFFWLANNVSHLQDIVKELNGQGYTIGSHSERHSDLGNLAKASSPTDFNGVNRSIYGPEVSKLPAGGFGAWKNQTLDREINQAVTKLSAVLGKPVAYFRLPYGSGTRNDLIGARFQALNLDHFFWRVDSLDWQDKNPDSIRDRVVTQMKAVKSGIILFHDIHPQSAAAAKLMVQYLQQHPDFKAVPLESLPGLKVPTK
jgi:peptidoglycan/xylan/chitin deacetylase (PgdA/CDA1 family)